MTIPLSVMMGCLIISQAIGPLLAAGLLSMDGLGGLEGWQWLFLIEGLMAVVIGFGWCGGARLGVAGAGGALDGRRALLQRSCASRWHDSPELCGQAGRRCPKGAASGAIRPRRCYASPHASSPAAPFPAPRPHLRLCMPPDLASLRCFTDGERSALAASFVSSHKPAAGGNQLRVLMRAATNPVVIACSVIKFARDVVLYGLIYCEW